MPPESVPTAPPAPRVGTTLQTRWPHLLLAAMLLTLHGAIAWGAIAWWERALLLAHFGLFLIWQPVWRGERQMPAALAALVLGLGIFFAVAGSWWLIGTWMAMLFGLIGGSVPGRAGRRDRLVSIIAAVYLITMLLMWVVPQVFTQYPALTGVKDVVRFGLIALPAAILLIPGGDQQRSELVIVDLFYSVMLFLLVVVLVLGSFVVYEVTHGAYLLGLAQTLMVIALVLVGLSWLWNPRAGFGGIGTLLSQYLLGLGLPFEQRMRRLAELAQAETRPEYFVRSALTDLLALPWVTGFGWVSSMSTGEVGERAAHAEQFQSGDLRLTLYAPRTLSPAVLLHLKLLMQMVGHFYEALRREQARQQSAYTQAIYETGARLTHDVKNLLQSLRSLCAAAEMRGADDDTAFRSLVQRQLPQIAQRLGATLDKLQSPQTTDTQVVDAAIWWEGLQARYAGRAIEFGLDALPPGQRVPAELFDSAADTLLENALYKVAQDPEVQVRVTLAPGPCLRVADDGVAVSAAVAERILRAPVASDSGLGVGLFQAARFAEQSGYRLVLAQNRDGAVAFELVPVR